MTAENGRFFGKLEHAWRRLLRDDAFRARVAFLRRVFLFEGLGGHAVALLASKVMEKSYVPGEVVFQQGDMGRACFIIAEGGVEITQAGPASGRAEVVATLEAGDFFGEMTLLDELPRSATARTTAASRLFILYKTHLDGLAEESPRVAAKLLHNLARLLSARLRRQRTPAVAADSTLQDAPAARP